MATNMKTVDASVDMIDVCASDMMLTLECVCIPGIAVLVRTAF